MKKLILSTLLASFVCIAMLKAEVKLPNVFADDMVLQCSMPIRFWGLGDKNTSVEVELGKNKVSAIVSKDGKWSLEATRCIGACGLAPVLTINDEVYGRLTTGEIEGILKKYQ